MTIPALANRLWQWGHAGRWRRFRRALADPGATQRRRLRGYLQANAETVFGRRHGFARIDSVAGWRRRVPLATWDELAPLVERIRRGEQRILTRQPVRRLLPSSGATAARKLIPFTDLLGREFQSAIGPWCVDLFRRHPRLATGRAYWSISPAIDLDDEPAAVPIGFDHDTAYLGGFYRRLVEGTLAVPAAVRGMSDVESFRYATLFHLLRAADLALISVWHPSFLLLLLEPLRRHWRRLLTDVADGTPSLPGAVGRSRPRCRPDPARAAELRRRGPDDPAALWPRLEVISCWADGHAGGAAAELAALFPGAVVEPKGLVATEAFVTLPFGGRRPVALRSHFFEFLDDRGRPWLLDELRRGAEYSVTVTTGGGLYRYRLQDRVRVEGFLAATPCLVFLGKEDRVSDRRGEKLTEGHVAGALERALAPLDLGVAFAMLAPDEGDSTPAYTLYLESRRPPPPELGPWIERRLEENPHYRYCRSLGQLEPLRIFRVEGGAHAVYVAHCHRAGQRLGDIKPAALSAESGWGRRFSGGYAGGPRRRLEEAVS